MIETALRKGSHFFEWTHQRLDGKPIHCTVLMTRMCVAGQVFLQGTVRNVSAIKQAEEACQESERKYRRIFDSFLDLYFQTDMEGTILNVSPSVLMLSGWSPEEVIGRSTLSLYANPQERERLRERLSRNGRVTDYEPHPQEEGRQPRYRIVVRSFGP